MSKFLEKVPKQSLFLAPMESVTDDDYRNVIFDHFGGWDFYACDFLRIPSEGIYPFKLVKKHYGEKTLGRKELRDKTYLQVLASEKSNIEPVIDHIMKLGIEWIDLNLGCPSKRVNGHKGGSYLLADIAAMAKIVRRLRKTFPGIFTAKIRLGYHDESDFFEILSALQDEGVEAITIHGRTRDQMYKGNANWDFIADAVEYCHVPIIGNGDIFQVSDIDKMFKHTNCHGVMAARGALQNPWLAKLYKSHRSHINEIANDNDFLQTYKLPRVKTYFDMLDTTLEIEPSRKLRRFKGLCKYVVADIEKKEEYQSKLLRSKNLNEFMGHIHSL